MIWALLALLDPCENEQHNNLNIVLWVDSYGETWKINSYLPSLETALGTEFSLFFPYKYINRHKYFLISVYETIVQIQGWKKDL